jgi:hypothetical protein
MYTADVYAVSIRHQLIATTLHALLPENVLAHTQVRRMEHNQGLRYIWRRTQVWEVIIFLRPGFLY